MALNTSLPQVVNPSYQLCPPPVRPADCQTAYEVGDVMLICERGQFVAVEVTDMRISCQQYPSGGSARSVWYTIKFLHVEKPFLAHSRIVGEKALGRVFQAYCWAVSK